MQCRTSFYRDMSVVFKMLGGSGVASRGLRSISIPDFVGNPMNFT